MTFYLCSLVVLIGTYFRPPQKLNGLMQKCAWLIPRSVGIRYRYEGLEHIPSSPCIWVGNHVNNFDPMAILAITPRHIVALEKEAHFHWPIYGAMVRRWGNLPVARSRDGTVAALERAKDALQAGSNVMVFPEGTRSRDGHLGRFQTGGFRLAIRAGTPILPFVFIGAYELWGRGMVLRPGSITVRFLPPVSPEGCSESQVRDLMDRVRSAILKALGSEKE